MKAETFLTTHRLFTREEFAESLRARGVAAATVNSHLARWLRQGRIASVKRGLFVRTDEADAEYGLPPEYLALASRLPSADLPSRTFLRR